MSRYDDIDHLLLDLDNERRYKDQIEMENADLENTIREYENYLRHLEDVATNGSAEDNEWKTRYEIQRTMDNHLSDYKSWLEQELSETEWKLHTGSYPDAMNCNLDLLTELELVRLVKHMERIKNDYYTSVCDTEYKTEKEAKEFHHFDEMRRCYKSDLRHAGQAIERMKMDELIERQAASTPPLSLSSPYVRWLDSQSMDDLSLMSKSPSRCHHQKSKSRSKSLSNKDHRRSCSKSPSRSKSRQCVCGDRSKTKNDTEEFTTAPDSEQGEEAEKGSGGDGEQASKD